MKLTFFSFFLKKICQQNNKSRQQIGCYTICVCVVHSLSKQSDTERKQFRHKTAILIHITIYYCVKTFFK